MSIYDKEKIDALVEDLKVVLEEKNPVVAYEYLLGCLDEWTHGHFVRVFDLESAAKNLDDMDKNFRK